MSQERHCKTLLRIPVYYKNYASQALISRYRAFYASACDEQRFPGIGRVKGQGVVNERITRTV